MSHVQFGRRASITTGTANTRNGTVRNVQAVDVGSRVQVTPHRQPDGKLAVKLVFESSRIVEQVGDEATPDIGQTEVQSTQLLELDQPGLVGSSTTSSTSVILITASLN